MQTAPTAPTKPKNPNRLSWAEFKAERGIDDGMAFLEEAMSDGICPALCREGCEVEPDGRCEHGCPSALLALGFI